MPEVSHVASYYQIPKWSKLSLNFFFTDPSIAAVIHFVLNPLNPHKCIYIVNFSLLM